MKQSLLLSFDKVEKTHWWWVGRRKLIKQLLLSTHPNKILDIGCGTGENLTFLKTLFPQSQVYGLDSMPTAISLAANRGHSFLKVGKAEKLPFPSSYFDTVLLLDVLEHIPNQNLALSEAFRVLKTDGLLLITSPALPQIWSPHDSNQGHQRRYTKQDFIDLTPVFKMPITFISYFNFFLSLPIIVIRVLSKWPPLSFMSSYDNSLNYDIIYHKKTNSLLRFIFTSEIQLLKQWKPPWGISLVVVMQKR